MTYSGTITAPAVHTFDGRWRFSVRGPAGRWSLHLDDVSLQRAAGGWDSSVLVGSEVRVEDGRFQIRLKGHQKWSAPAFIDGYRKEVPDVSA